MNRRSGNILSEMGSAAVFDLCRLLLQQSDLHPIGTLNGHDLAEYDENLVGTFLAEGLLVQGGDLRDADGSVFFADEDLLIVADTDGDGGVARGDPRSVQRYEIGFEAICRQLRAGLSLGGLLVLNRLPNVTELGMQTIGRRRRAYYLARVLGGDGALQPLLSIAAHAVPGSEIVVLTPTIRNLSRDVLRRIDRDRMTVAAISELLVAGERPFTIDVPETLGSTCRDPADRLFIDLDGHVASFDDNELELTRRELRVLGVLTSEARDGGGIVSRDWLMQAIEAESGRDGLQTAQLDQVISLLRRKLVAASRDEKEDGKALIRTAHRLGYRLMLPPEGVAIL